MAVSIDLYSIFHHLTYYCRKMESLGNTSIARLSTIGLSKPIVLESSIYFNEVNIAYF